MTTPPTVGVVACAAGGIENLRVRLIEPMIERGWRVAVTLTPAAAVWLESIGESAKIEEIAGLPVRSAPRMPSEARPHPPVDVYAVAPATANSFAKMALGLADNQAMTQVCEAIGAGIPVVVFPSVNAAHVRHPAWEAHLNTLTGAGVHVIYGDDVWPLHEPRSGVERELPWDAIISAIESSVSN